MTKRRKDSNAGRRMSVVSSVSDDDPDSGEQPLTEPAVAQLAEHLAVQNSPTSSSLADTGEKPVVSDLASLQGSRESRRRKKGGLVLKREDTRSAESPATEEEEEDDAANVTPFPPVAPPADPSDKE